MTQDSGEPKLLGQGRYRVRGSLGRGAQAETLWAEDSETQEQVAIKRFEVRGAKSWKDVELAEREANVLARLSHPNLPKYIGHFEEDGALFLVMEKIEGVTLAELRDKGALDQATVARFLHDLADTLSYLHGRSPPIVHRDIKPHNVILRPDGGFSLVDFGSVQEKLRPEGGSTVVGTFGYMAPEQFQGRAGPATDVYGAGATAIACLSGLAPEQLPHRGLAIDVQAALAGHFAPAWIELLTRLLEPDPDKRARSLKDALAATLDQKQRIPDARAVRPSYGPATQYGSRKERRRAERAAKKERKALRSAARLERRQSRGLRRGPSARLLIFVVLGLIGTYRLGAFGLLPEAIPILLSVLGVVFGVSWVARRLGHNAPDENGERSAMTPFEALLQADDERRFADLQARAEQALRTQTPGAHESDAPDRLRIDVNPNPREAERDVVGFEHPPENHRNSRMSR